MLLPELLLLGQLLAGQPVADRDLAPTQPRLDGPPPPRAETLPSHRESALEVLEEDGEEEPLPSDLFRPDEAPGLSDEPVAPDLTPFLPHPWGRSLSHRGPPSQQS